MRFASAATSMIAALIVIGLAGHTYRIPIQVSDSLELIQQVRAMPSVRAAFVAGLHASPTMLRPLRQAQTKLLLDAGRALGGRYHLAFRGYHVILMALLILLFVSIARVNSWADAVAAIVGLTVLIGTHTFSGFLREAYPVNHFLLIAICALATLAIAFGRGGRVSDIAALLLFVIAALTLESGVLLWVVAVAAYASGLRGISWRAIVALSVLVVGYVVLRESLHIHAPAVGDRPTALGVVALSREQQIARFGSNPLAFYAYNTAMSILSVLVSQPRAGRWTVVEAGLRAHVSPSFYLEILSSIAATALIAWYVAGRDDHGRRRWREPIPLVFLSVLLANGVLSYAYAKSEIVSLSGVLYALAVMVALRPLLARLQTARLGVLLASALLVFNLAWSIRAASLHAVLIRAASSAGTEWITVLMPRQQDAWPRDRETLDLTMRLKREALSDRGMPPDALPKWVHEWWGEE